jgi:hypothetical protein
VALLVVREAYVKSIPFLLLLFVIVMEALSRLISAVMNMRFLSKFFGTSSNGAVSFTFC